MPSDSVERRVEIGGQEVNFASGAASRLRRKLIGFVFQHATLAVSVRASKSLHRRRQFGNAEQGGQAAYCDVARATGHRHLRPPQARRLERWSASARGGRPQHLFTIPRIVLADEPTAALDWENGQIAVSMLIEQTKSEQALLLTVTHDTRLIELFDRVIYLDSGKVRPA